MIIEHQNAELKNLRSFNEKALTLGIPAKLFAGALGVSIIFTIMISFMFGFLALLMLLVPLYIIHKNDSEAAYLYLTEFMSADRLTHDVKESSQLFIVVEGSRLMSFDDFFAKKTGLTPKEKKL